MSLSQASTEGLWSPGNRNLTVGLVLTITLVAFEALAVATVMPIVEQELGDIELYGWVFTAFRLMAKLRGLRGTPLDVFGYTAERRGERALIGEYEKTIALLLNKLDGGNVDLAADIASIPEHIRGYGHVKEAHLHKAKAREAELLKEWDNPLRVVQAA